MANEDFQTFLESRLRALDASIDLSPGSPAQVQFIAPVMTRLGTDPFEVDIEDFILDRFRQDFPEVYADDPSVIRDTFIKPLILILDPFKRETETIKRNQSLQDPTIISDDEADALVANFFDERSSGGYAVGVVRAYFSNPANVQIEITTRFYTADGLNFFPSSPISITAEEMVFNRSGPLFFMDIPVAAENVGADYNISPEAITGVVGLYGAVKVTNLREFSEGKTKIDTPSFVAQARQSLTERSLVTRRGATARLKSVFQGDVRAIQVIGAKDVEMQRDILVATSPGHAWLWGQVSLYGNLALVQCHTVDDPLTTTAPSPGDTLLVYLNKYLTGFASLDQAKRMLRFTVEEVLSGPMDVGTAPYQVAYLVRWSGTPPVGVTLPTSLVTDGGFSKKGTVAISSLPSVGSVSLVVNNQEVHVYGHSDVYVRPVLQTTSKAVLSNLADDPTKSDQFKIHRVTLTTNGGALSDQNRVVDPDGGGFDFSANGVEAGDLLSLENGDDAGVYTIGKVTGGSPSYLYLTQNLTVSATNLRYRIIKKVHINPFEPKIPKVPFGSIPNNDLITSIGSNVFEVSQDLVDLGVAVGDTFRILEGFDEGDFTVTGFDGSGDRIIVDRAAGATNTGLHYEVFTSLESVELPLVRLKKLSVLDSSKQATGTVVPYAEPVALTPTCSFSAAQVRGYSQRKSGVILPALTDEAGGDDYVTGTNVAAVSGDRRYSLGFDPYEGMYKAMLFANGSRAEFDFPSDADEECSYFLASAEETTKSVNYPPVDPKPGDALTIKSGPNKGSYLIRKVRKFKYDTASGNDVWLYFIKIYGRFPVDVLRQLIKFLDDNGSPVTKITNVSGTISFPSFFTTIFDGLGGQLNTVLASLGVTSPGATTLQEAVEGLTLVDYEWGDPARGVIRSYFIEPTLFQQHTADHDVPTIYNHETESGEVLSFRPDPTRYEKFEVVPPRVRADADPLEYYRDMTNAVLTQPLFTDVSHPTVFAVGVRPDDVLSVHQETFFHGSLGQTADRMTAIQTLAGSTVVTAPAASGTPFTEEMVGNLFFIEEGVDKGGYRITRYISPNQIALDRAMSASTPSVLSLVGITTQGSGASWGYDGSNNKITMPSSQGWTSALINKYVTLYGMNSAYQGSYKILTVPTTSELRVERPVAIGNFPAYPQAGGFWVITDAPTSPPKNVGTATELHGLRPIRMYDDVVSDYVVTDVVTSPSTSQVTVAASILAGVKQPYRIYRKNLRRVNPTEMSEQREDSLYYFDTEVLSLGPSPAHNIPRDSYLTLEPDTYESEGYRFSVDDRTLSYSMKESGTLEMPSKILPLESADSLDGYLNLAQTPIEISYERAEVVKQFQDFLDSPEDRVVVANMLARHFLPAYVSYDAIYAGGSAPSVVAEDIIEYIDNLPIETPIDVSEVQRKIEDRGGNPDTPTSVVALVHGWDRRIWAEFSENSVGLTDETDPTKTSVPYDGTPRVSYFVPGPDVSGQEDIEDGERINLTRR